MHWQISTQTSTKYCFCVSRDKKIQCISSASKQQQFKDNESLWRYLHLNCKTSARLEGLENGPKKECGTDHWGWSSCWPSSLQNITDVITVSYGRRGSRWQVGVGRAGGTPPRLLCLGSDQFPAKTASRLVRVTDQSDLWTLGLERKVHEVSQSRRRPLLHHTY